MILKSAIRHVVGITVALYALAGSAAAPAAGTAPVHPPMTSSPHAATPARAASGPGPVRQKPAPSPRLDINSATKAQLKTLPGIGDAEADKILAHRPYLVSTEIVSKAGLPEGIYFQVRRQIVAMPKTALKKAKSSP